MTAIHDQPIEHPAAWTSAALGSQEALVRTLSDAELAAFDALLQETAHLAPQAVTRAQVTQPALVRLAEDVRREIMDGRGVVLLRGVRPERYAAKDMERIYWAIGTHLGVPAVQSRTGDKLGRVEQDPNDPVSRGYRSSGELVMHTDSYEVVGLMCIRKARKGGQSALVSSLAIHNAIRAERPELLPALYEGAVMAIPEAQASRHPLTATAIPVFCDVGGVVSCMYAASFMRAAARLKGTSLPPALDEALTFFSQTAERDDLALRFHLEPGEMLIWHNFTQLHSRTHYEDDPAHPRLLLRLWLTAHASRPVVPEFRERARVYDLVYAEYRDKAAS
ncbi:TauD/TfdA family dioxygenase [Hydrogenophaga sp. BPS33]|uniref:TauD/TfdA family dioxygenase n=1 Tax=Hydrogenophaga sp. BPS33 TaxID=2651974 RepID=UPI00131FFCC0|nr:TauD/TfdA family dioxygenase [Hydrogenophaga sp. BPS33]QHE88324.1 TauD/TfdA family dioxygenase [Hydrogenophaga sp. BPS33]